MSVIMRSVTRLSVIKVSFIILSVIMLSLTRFSVIKVSLNVMPECHYYECGCADCHYAQCHCDNDMSL